MDNLTTDWFTVENERVVRFEDWERIKAQRDELLEACKNAERELEEGVMSGVVAQHLRAVIRERY